jgi:hypothetical protein
MRTRSFITVAAGALALLLGGVVHAQSAASQNPATPTLTPPTPAVQASTASDYHQLMRIYHNRSVAYALTLYDYARKSEGPLDPAVVKECVNEIEDGIGHVNYNLDRIQAQIEGPDVGEQRELTDIRNDYGVAYNHVTRLKIALADTQVNRRLVESESEAIYAAMTDAGGVMDRLRTNMGVKVPPLPSPEVDR